MFAQTNSKHLFAVTLLLNLYSAHCYSASETQISTIDLFSLSLQELMNVKIQTGSLTNNSPFDSPSAITIITQEQILTTPARNIMDLLETYVPGLLLTVDNASGPIIRIRGLGERHAHTLLLVNGKPVNQKAYQGSMVELRNWDMGDIERIEVARGPASVTHGPGAISGVINIISKKNNDQEGLTLGFERNHDYEGNAIKLSYAVDVAGAKVYLYGSITETEGNDDYRIYQTKSNGDHGYKGSDAFSDADANPLQAYYGDYDDEPQLKLHADVAFNEQWRFWARYNNSGQNNASTQRELQGKMQDRRMFQSRYYIFSLENRQSLSSTVVLNSLLSYDSEEYAHTRDRNTELSPTDEINIRYGFSEDEIYLRSSLDYSHSEDLSVVTAFEYSHDSLGAPWGKSSSSFMARAGGEVFISSDSKYLGDGSGGTVEEEDVAEFTKGWSTNTYSLSTELNYNVVPSVTTILSGRLDKNDQTAYMFSPRYALLYQPDEENTVKLSWQRSLRQNTMMELHWLDINGRKNEADPEQTTTYELAYRRQHDQNMYFSITGFHNKSEVLSWDGTNVNLVGIIESYGIEPEFSYHNESLLLGINHSFFELLNWDFNLKQDDGSAIQFISYSDMLYTQDYLTLNSTGNSLNNWVNNQTKLWLDYKFSDEWSVHTNVRIVWEYEYGQDLYDMYEQAFAKVDTAGLSAEDLADYNEDRAFLAEHRRVTDDKDIHGRDVRLNASLMWKMPYFQDTRLIIYGQNLIDMTGNKRQKRNFTAKTLPVSGWIEEPRMIGMKLNHKF